MSVAYEEKGKLLNLHTEHTTYQMCVDEAGFLRHLYYGPRAEGADFRCLHRAYDRGFSGNPYEMRYDRTFSHDTIPQEYPGAGVGDYRIQTVAVTNPDGSPGVDFRYVSHEIRPGKYALPGLPAAFAKDGEAETLIVTLRDRVTGLGVRLYYGVYPERDIITRAAELFNEGAGVMYLEKAASVCLDLPFGSWDLLHFHGRHCMERQPERLRVGHDAQYIESKRGHSSHHHSPFAVLCGQETGEDIGPAYGLMLSWSGNHKTEVEGDYLGSVRVVMGANDSQFRWTLEPGASFYTPEVILTYSGEGFGELSRRYHDFIRFNVCKSRYIRERRPVLLNNWEATYFDFNTDKLLDIARQAAELGVELFVMDDGWFGSRNDDNAGLGDWFVNEQKLPGGLDPLIQGVNALGMKFGLWVEPEMVNEDSDLYRAHPDWALAMPGRPPAMCRNQLVLDMGREDVREYLYNCIADLLKRHRIEYVKWDMNRPLADVYSRVLPPERQGEAGYRYVLGLYDLMERLTEDFPDVLFEGCSGGGGRFDAGMLRYTPQIWCSDNTDAAERAAIQYGTSFGFPVTAMGSHVSACPNHQTNRTVSLHTRGVVAMSGTFGYELDLNKLTDEEKEEVRRQIQDFRKYYWLIQDGLYYRLNAAPVRARVRADCESVRQYTAWEFVSRDRREALVNLVTGRCHANTPPVHIFLKGLDPAAMYREEGEGRLWPGAALLYGGYTFPVLWGDYQATQLHLVRVDE